LKIVGDPFPLTGADAAWMRPEDPDFLRQRGQQGDLVIAQVVLPVPDAPSGRTRVLPCNLASSRLLAQADDPQILAIVQSYWRYGAIPLNSLEYFGRAMPFDADSWRFVRWSFYVNAALPETMHRYYFLGLSADYSHVCIDPTLHQERREAARRHYREYGFPGVKYAEPNLVHDEKNGRWYATIAPRKSESGFTAGYDGRHAIPDLKINPRNRLRAPTDDSSPS
jgi:hypothetical protein